MPRNPVDGTVSEFAYVPRVELQRLTLLPTQSASTKPSRSPVPPRPTYESIVDARYFLLEFEFGRRNRNIESAAYHNVQKNANEALVALTVFLPFTARSAIKGSWNGLAFTVVKPNNSPCISRTSQPSRNPLECPENW